jgi:hypothetical protein
MVVKPPLTFKGVAHKAARLDSVWKKAALGAEIVLGEIPVIKPTVAIASMTVGASAASIHKALKVSPVERDMMIVGALTLGELNEQFKPLVESDDAETVSTEAFTGAKEPISAEQMLANLKASLSGPPRLTVDEMIEVYVHMTPSEQIALGRAIGVERVWIPSKRKRRMFA